MDGFARDTTVSQMIRFAGAGVAGFAVDLFVLFLLTRAGVSPLAARVPSSLLSIATTYAINRRTTFRSGASGLGIGAEFFRYFVASGVGLLLNWALYALGVQVLHVSPVTALVAATGGSMLVNFFNYKHIVFRTVSTTTAEGKAAGKSTVRLRAGPQE